VLLQSTLPAGTVFHGRYRVVRALKVGGMGTVYEAMDANTESPRALKVMLPSILADAEQRGRFALEARVTGSIESDHLVRVSDSGIDEASGSPFLVMELLRGEELGELLRRQRALPPAEVVSFLSQVALALDKTHAANIVHRDLKPGNLFVTRRDDGTPCVKILDFGIAKVVAQNQATKTRSLGTPLYMAPEQIKGEVGIGPRADLYSLAHVAFALLTGEAYFREDSTAEESLYALVTKIMAGAVEAPSVRALRRGGVQLPPAFDAWFFKATAVSAEARFDRATTEIAALAEALAVGASPPAASAAVAAPAPAPAPVSALAAAPLPAPAGPAAKSNSVLLALVAVGAVLLLGVLVLGVSLLRGGSSGSCAPGATCLATDLPDPAHVDAQAILPAVLKIAKNVDSRAVLAVINAGDVTKDGTSDLTGDHMMSYSFSIPGGTISVTLRKKLAVITRTPPLSYSASTPEPRCSMRAAWKTAVGGGMPASASANFTYSNAPSMGGAIWMISYGTKSYIVDGQTCALKKY